jgi:hypothetical protein
VRRAVTLTTLTILLLAVAGVTVARESTIGPERSSQTESAVQDLTTTTGEPTASTSEPTDAADEGSTEGSDPAAGGVTEEYTQPEADEPEITEEPEVAEEQATRGVGENEVKMPEGIGEGKGLGGKHLGDGKIKDEKGEASRGQAQESVTLCHKGKKTLRVGAPAQAAHARHGDTVGPCPTERVTPEPEEKPGPGVAQNGDGSSGNGQQKVTLCHKGKTLTVGAPAADAHLRHGDTHGECG